MHIAIAITLFLSALTAAQRGLQRLSLRRRHEPGVGWQSGAVALTLAAWSAICGVWILAGS
jgi:hypothetical protein